MTIVVCDGASIASDGAVIGDDTRFIFDTQCKFGVIGDGENRVVYAFAGVVSKARQLERYLSGAAKRPPKPDGLSYTHAVLRNGVWTVTTDKEPMATPMPSRWQIGSGHNVAIAPAALGLSALAAVYATARTDTTCDFPVYVARIADLLEWGSEAIEQLTQQQAADRINGEKIAPL